LFGAVEGLAIHLVEVAMIRSRERDMLSFSRAERINRGGDSSARRCGVAFDLLEQIPARPFHEESSRIRGVVH
jgi:hypothetical protein